MRVKALKVLAIVALMSGLSVAVAGDGGLVTGTAGSIASNGSFEINVTKNDAVKISKLSLIDFGSATSATADMVAKDADGACYYATTANYTITMDSANATPFNLKSGANNMPYKLEWTDFAGAVVGSSSWGNGGSIADNVATAQLPSLNKTDVDCAVGNNANMKVTILQADFNTAPAGFYADTVNITIAGM